MNLAGEDVFVPMKISTQRAGILQTLEPKVMPQMGLCHDTTMQFLGWDGLQFLGWGGDPILVFLGEGVALSTCIGKEPFIQIPSRKEMSHPYNPNLA